MEPSDFRSDLTISGTVSATGGVYNDVKVRGEGRVDGDVDCRTFTCMGRCEFFGSLTAAAARITGDAIVSGNMRAAKAKVLGNLDIHGNADLQEVLIRGALTVDGSLSGDEIEIKGMLKAKGDCQAEAFLASGGFTVGGLLNAGTIDVRLYGECKAQEIGGDLIHVRRGFGSGFGAMFKSLFFSSGGSLTAGTIEGDDIYLEYTKASVVRGNNVTIGPGCDIGLVEYKEAFQQDKGTRVTDSRKV
ncbi:polymer-forming cytoskeletal protein [Brevibacillus thermoruber]|jgi:cytoskeletal protein CcmA (bactofilin family)|uniref:polymer-forming cytoskeletal protein n=1 Tax=Brevibacillus thermoruber TaxID=33942 RepID=UPI004041A916